jgi:hypothetical protein
LSDALKFALSTATARETPSKKHSKTWGSWLASDGGLTVNINVEYAALIAGKPGS